MGEKSELSGYLKLLLTAVLWGGTFIAGRLVAREAGPFAAAFLRFALAGAVLLPLARREAGGTHPLTRRQVWPVLILAITGVFAYNVCFFTGLKYIAAGRAALIIALNPVCIALLAAAFLGEKLTPTRVAGIAIAVGGALVVISRGDPGAFFAAGPGRGELYILGCVLSWGTYSVVGRKVMTAMSPLAAVSRAALLGAALLLPPAVAEGLISRMTGYSVTAWISIIYLALGGTVVGFVWYYEGIRRIGPTRAGIFINFVPVSAVLLARLMLDEPLSGSLLAGAVLVCLGAWLTNRRPRNACCAGKTPG
ncbi:MAG: DMT family transporter [Deltaproteobacteria bacterium]|nr:DMT family transporter [Candidatus Anaeroferrophillacea bacterium]